METKGGYLVISLDLELYWGMIDKVTLEAYGPNIKGVHTVLPKMLDLFAEHDIHATWATVGMLMARNKDELISMLPRETHRPQYPDMRISTYAHIDSAHIGKDEKDDPYHFGSSLIHEILDTPGQELASHTFSHYYCIDGKDNRASVFAADLELQREVFAIYDVRPTSIVFPRNQFTEEALRACFEHGITAYRGNEDHFLYRGGTEKPRYIRALRLLDAYLNISGHNTIPLRSLVSGRMHNIPSSHFLRPYSKRLRWLERMRLRRIKKSMTRAAKHGEICHLWWHPHNFGVNATENMGNLRDLLAHFEVLRETYGMQSRSMHELAEFADATLR